MRIATFGREVEPMNRTLSLLAFAAPLCTLPLGSSCVVAAVAGATVLVTDEFRDNAVSVVLPISPELAWAGTKTSLSAQTDALIHEDSAHWTLKTTMGSNVETAQVLVHVEEFDVGQTRILVEAKKFMVHNAALSDRILRQIEADLTREIVR
jgi:hypothetical protein